MATTPPEGFCGSEPKQIFKADFFPVRKRRVGEIFLRNFLQKRLSNVHKSAPVFDFVNFTLI